MMLGACSDRYAEFCKLIAFTFGMNMMYSELSTNFIMYALNEAVICVVSMCAHVHALGLCFLTRFLVHVSVQNS